MRATVRLLVLMAACQAGPVSMAAPSPVAVPRDAGPPPSPDAASVASAEGFDYAKWLVANGARNGYDDVHGCTELVVGAAREPAVLCTQIEEVTRAIRGSDMPAFRVVTHKVIRAVRQHGIVTLLDAVIRFEALDAPPRPPGAPPIVDPIEVAADGRSVKVGDPTTDCKGVAARAARELAALPADDKEGRAWIVLDRDLQARVCASRGRYVWRGGRFVRS